MILAIAYWQWELTVMWVEAQMKCDEVTDKPTGLLQHTDMQTCQTTATHSCSSDMYKKLQISVSLMVGGNEPLVWSKCEIGTQVMYILI